MRHYETRKIDRNIGGRRVRSELLVDEFENHERATVRRAEIERNGGFFDADTKDIRDTREQY